MPAGLPEKDETGLTPLEALKKHEKGLEESMATLKVNLPKYGLPQIQFLLQMNMSSQNYFKEMYTMLIKEQLKRHEEEETRKNEEEVESDTETVILEDLPEESEETSDK